MEEYRERQEKVALWKAEYEKDKDAKAASLAVIKKYKEEKAAQRLAAQGQH